MFKLSVPTTVVVAQGCGALMMSVLACFWSKAVALSLLAGATCCILPNAWFALRLATATRRGQAGPQVFWTGELIKVIATIMLMVLFARTYPALNWGGFLTGLVVALKSAWVVPFTSLSRK